MKKNVGLIASILIKNCFPPWLVWIFAKYFIAGKNKDSAILKASELNKLGFNISIDYIGEDASDIKEVERSKIEYISLIDLMKKSNIMGDISLKLSHFGIFNNEPDREARNLLGEALFGIIAAHAARKRMTIWIDAERLKSRASTWKIAHRCFSGNQNIGICIQAYFKDAPLFLRAQIKDGWHGPIRVCKGAYREADRDLVSNYEGLHRNFIEICQIALLNNCYLQIATHDNKLIDLIKNITHNKPHEFAMLLGVNQKTAKELVSEGRTVKIYIPYGEDFKGYVARRIMERPEYILLPFKKFLRA